MANNSENSTCEPLEVAKAALLLPLPVIGILVNVTVGCAATFYRKSLLRQNYVYLCVISTLLSNVVFLALNLWDSSATVDAIVQHKLTNLNDTSTKLWVICQAGAASMLFVMSWNLCAFIYVMLDTTYFRSAARINQDTSAASNLARKRFKTIFLIVFSWTIPTAMALVGVLVWNCGYLCECFHGAVGELCPARDGCSKLWPPLKNGYMGLQVGLWFIEVIGLMFFVVCGFKDFLKFSGLNKQKSDSAKQIQSSVEATNQKPATNNGNGFHNQTESIPITRSRIPSWHSFNPRLQLALILSALFVLLTMSIVILFFIDISQNPFDIEAGRALSQTFVHLYTLLCPIMMVHYMPNLRRALARFFTKILFCFS